MVKHWDEISSFCCFQCKLWFLASLLLADHPHCEAVERWLHRQRFCCESHHVFDPVACRHRLFPRPAELFEHLPQARAVAVLHDAEATCVHEVGPAVFDRESRNSKYRRQKSTRFMGSCPIALVVYSGLAPLSCSREVVAIAIPPLGGLAQPADLQIFAFAAPRFQIQSLLEPGPIASLREHSPSNHQLSACEPTTIRIRREFFPV